MKKALLIGFGIVLVGGLGVYVGRALAHHGDDLGSLPAMKAFTDELSTSETTTIGAVEKAYQVLVETEGQPGLHSIDDNYARDAIGVYGNHKKTLPTNTYVNANVEVTDHLKDFLRRTDHLEAFWGEDAKTAGKQRRPWHYAYHLASNTIRLLPWIDFPNLFGPTTKWSLVRYFDSMEKVKTQENATFCTRPFFDAGGTGLSTTCCRLFDPTGDYQDVALSCTNYSFRAALETLRANLPKDTQCVEAIALKSSAPAIAYEPETMFDLRTGNATTGQDLIRKRPGTYVPVVSLPAFKVDVSALTTCD